MELCQGAFFTIIAADIDSTKLLVQLVVTEGSLFRFNRLNIIRVRFRFVGLIVQILLGLGVGS